MKIIWTLLLLIAGLPSVSLAQETVSERDLPQATDSVSEEASTEDADTTPQPPPDPFSPEALANQPVIPKAYQANRYESAWEKNPFLLKTKGPEIQTTSWAQDWALAGMFNNGGRIRVSLVNKQTGEYKNITSFGDPDPEFRLVEANFDRDRSEAFVKVAKGSDEQVLKYDDNLTSKPITVNNTQHVPPNANANPNAKNANVAPGQVGNPGQNRPGAPTAANPGTATLPGVGGAQQNPNVNTSAGPVPPNAKPPSISRRRQLIPGNAPQQPPQQ